MLLIIDLPDIADAHGKKHGHKVFALCASSRRLMEICKNLLPIDSGRCTVLASSPTKRYVSSLPFVCLALEPLATILSGSTYYIEEKAIND